MRAIAEEVEGVFYLELILTDKEITEIKEKAVLQEYIAQVSLCKTLNILVRRQQAGELNGKSEA